MTDAADAAAAAELADALHVWRVDPRGQTEELLAAAARALESGVDLPAVRALAEATGEESYAATSALVDDAAVALSVPTLEGADLQDAAVAAMVRRHLSGRVTPRELTYWVTRVVGLRATARAHVFLSLEDEYCAYPWGEEELAALDARVTEAAHAFLTGPEETTPGGLKALLGRWRTRRS